jgi:hypothetical protein
VARVIGYASRTGTRRNLAALRREDWRLLISSAGVHRDEGFRFAIDNGKWSAHTTGQPWDEAAFERLLGTHGPRADWIVVPDIVCGGAESLALSRAWLPRLQARRELAGRVFLIAVQDGMTPADLHDLAGPSVGIFVGGSTEWKEASMTAWCAFARERQAIAHIGRVNSVRRIFLCAAAGATSFDGSSGSMYARNIPMLANAARQTDLELLIRRAA